MYNASRQVDSPIISIIEALPVYRRYFTVSSSTQSYFRKLNPRAQYSAMQYFSDPPNAVFARLLHTCYAHFIATV